ncbi:MAG TPA: ABC transporter permease [Gemmatimonadales bacterium]
MRLPPGLRRVFRLDSGRSDADPDIRSEIEFHLQTRIDELVAQGMSPAAARDAAMGQFGSPERVAAEVGDIDARIQAGTGRREWWSGVMQDLRISLRGARRTPLYALVASITFALGIGANAAVFSLLDAVVIRPLPFPGLDRLVRIYEHDTKEDRPFGQITIADFRDWQSQTTTFEGLAAFRYRFFTLTGTGEAQSLMGGQVSPAFFDILGIRPFIGRAFRNEEGASGAPGVAILSHGAWVRLFGADSSIVGRAIRLNNEEAEVIGVLPREFVNPLGEPLDVWTPSDFEAVASDQARARRMHFLAGFGRIREGIEFERANEELLTVGRRLETDHREMNKGHLPQMIPLQEAGISTVRPVLWLVMGAVGLVLLIACANLANLVFARTLSRSRELAVRSALGAGRWRLVRQVMIEQLLLAGFGGVIGVLAASWTSAAFVGLLGQSMPRAELVRTDGRVLVFALMLTLVAALASGLLPAFHAARADFSDALKAGSHGSTLSRQSHRLRSLLVTVQVGLAAVLIVGSALALRSLSTLLDQELGFETESVWVFSAPAVPARYPEAPQILAFQADFLERLRSLPGVASASAAYSAPMLNVSTTSIVPEGVILPPGPAPAVGYNAAYPDYFRVMGIPLLRGRLMDARDRMDAPPVVVVNQALADRHWPGQHPIGKRARMGPDPNAPWVEVVGVVANIRRRNVQLPPEPEVYYPLTQDVTRGPSYVVRVAGDPAPVLAGIRAALRALDREIPLGNLRPLTEVVAGSLRQPRFLSALLTLFGGLALVLAAVGIYGVIAFLVAERRREIGVRLALGAGSARVVRQTLWRGLRPVLAGLGLGLVAAVLAGRLAANLFYQVKAADPLALGAAAVVLLLAGVVGCLAPARRAAKVEPGIVLRE